MDRLLAVEAGLPHGVAPLEGALGGSGFERSEGVVVPGSRTTEDEVDRGVGVGVGRRRDVLYVTARLRGEHERAHALGLGRYRGRDFAALVLQLSVACALGRLGEALVLVEDEVRHVDVRRLPVVQLAGVVVVPGPGRRGRALLARDPLADAQGRGARGGAAGIMMPGTQPGTARSRGRARARRQLRSQPGYGVQDLGQPARRRRRRAPNLVHLETLASPGELARLPGTRWWRHG